MFYVKLLDLKSNPYTLTSLNAPGMESMAVNSLTLDQYHRICWFNLTQHRNTPISPAITMDLSAVLCWPSGSQFQDSVQIASIPDAEIPPDSWQCSWTKGAVMGDVMENGWTRYHCSDALLTETFTLNQSRVYNCSSWLCQANYVFTRLQITSNLENYGIVEDIDFCVDIAGTIEDLPAGYLFLCPVKHFRTGSSSYRWPACPAYWSLDPTGTEHLSNEEATRLGFPTISLKTSISFLYWDASVYAGLRKFHQAKGFDPDSQEVARHLGQLLELVGEEEVPLGRADEPSDFWADNEDWNLGFVDLDDPLNLPDKDNVLWDEED
ncbi:hypothetical protein DFH06DRAFT_510532 [Mycena polygramma]|nr:hypothetical protein DFH06DRAFT_510532 [Mycena polygramma]